ncbi:hypothetical protein BD410DRAFT_901724 [Rickenella mellea]|uniref:Uncharacterized protein n=1 Tax=Rickenella mellea TaxID=50990 RepID=A0A4Y7PPG2_9AGAM|nr:hypothetical protein BD410DRAFT_901724 [Rickenella mellea]
MERQEETRKGVVYHKLGRPPLKGKALFGGILRGKKKATRRSDRQAEYYGERMEGIELQPPFQPGNDVEMLDALEEEFGAGNSAQLRLDPIIVDQPHISLPFRGEMTRWQKRVSQVVCGFKKGDELKMDTLQLSTSVHVWMTSIPPEFRVPPHSPHSEMVCEETDAIVVAFGVTTPPATTPVETLQSVILPLQYSGTTQNTAVLVEDITQCNDDVLPPPSHVSSPDLGEAITAAVDMSSMNLSIYNSATNPANILVDSTVSSPHDLQTRDIHDDWLIKRYAEIDRRYDVLESYTDIDVFEVGHELNI